jgi:hypothetical protein
MAMTPEGMRDSVLAAMAAAGKPVPIAGDHEALLALCTGIVDHIKASALVTGLTTAVAVNTTTGVGAGIQVAGTGKIT